MGSVINFSGYAEPGEAFCELTERLSEASVRRHWEAYGDVEWEAPEHVVHPEDPRWEATERWDPLAMSTWYRDQAPEDRSAMGLRRQAQLLRAGTEFEAVLGQGLLRFAARLPCRHPAFRYVYHEIVEEAQHSMMNQEFINRSGCDLPATSEEAGTLLRRMVDFAESYPALFFLAVLCGEEVFDHLQRRLLASPSTHPLIRRISKIHVTEEARHVSFARHLLLDVVPRLDPREVRFLRYQAPMVIEWTGGYLFDFSRVLLPAVGVPEDVRQMILEDPLTKDIRTRSMAKMVAFCEELALVDRRSASVWERLRG